MLCTPVTLEKFIKAMENRGLSESALETLYEYYNADTPPSVTIISQAWFEYYKGIAYFDPNNLDDIQAIRNAWEEYDLDEFIALGDSLGILTKEDHDDSEGHNDLLASWLIDKMLEGNWEVMGTEIGTFVVAPTGEAESD